MAYTLAQFRGVIRQRMGWPATDDFAVDAELNSFIRDSARELWALLASSFRAGTWGVNEFPIVTVVGTPGYALPNADPSIFGKLISVRMLYSNRLEPLMRRDHARDGISLTSRTWTPMSVTYSVFKNASGSPRVVFDPPPDAAYTVLVDYIQGPPALAADADTSWLDYDEYIIVDCMIKLREKEEADVSTLLVEKRSLKERIEMEAAPVDAGGPPTIVDARREYHDRDLATDWFRRYP